MPGARVERGERVVLRTVEREDVPFLQRGYANPELRYPLGAPLRTRAEIETWLDEDDGHRFLVCLDEETAGPEAPEDDESRPIGFLSVNDADWRRPDFVYWIVPEHHGAGYGREAVSLAVEYTFRTYDVPAVGATVYAFNDASRGLLESLGFVEEGRLRKDRFVDGRYVDSVQYGLLREERRMG
jgi:[ribosomal protein S5]-alanine N-acetyltransferase